MDAAVLININTNPAEALVLLDRENARLNQLCATLEAMADALPAAIGSVETIDILKSTASALDRHIELQEIILFPCLRRGANTSFHLEGALRQLEYEHCADKALIIEIIETAMRPPPAAARFVTEPFGYLLRLFFECYRRHSAWENEVLVPSLHDITRLNDQ